MTRDDLKCVVDQACVSNAAGPDYLWPGFTLEPRLWEALRTELQSRYRRSTGEAMAVLTIQLTTEALSDLIIDPALIGIADKMKESGGHWQPCTGCYDTEDGHPTQKYDYSSALETAIGCGCHECGGLGAVWWHMTEQEIADFEKICDDVDAEVQLSARIARLEFALRSLSKAYAACNGEDHPAYEVAQRELAAPILTKTGVRSSDDLRKRVMRAIFDPGATEGFKGERDLTTWQTDAVMRALATPEGSAG